MSYSIATLGQQLNWVGCRILLHASFHQLCCKPTAHVGLSMCFSVLQYIQSYFALHYQNTNNLYTGSQTRNSQILVKHCTIIKWRNLLTCNIWLEVLMTVVFWLWCNIVLWMGPNSLHVPCILYLSSSVWFYPPSASQSSKLPLYMLFFNQYSVHIYAQFQTYILGA